MGSRQRGPDGLQHLSDVDASVTHRQGIATDDRTAANIAKIAESRAHLERLKLDVARGARPSCRTAGRIAKVHEDMASHLEGRAFAQLRNVELAEAAGDFDTARRLRRQFSNDLVLVAAQLENAVWTLTPPAVQAAAARAN